MRTRIERARRQDESLVLVEVIERHIFGTGNSVTTHGIRSRPIPTFFSRQRSRKSLTDGTFKEIEISSAGAGYTATAARQAGSAITIAGQPGGRRQSRADELTEIHDDIEAIRVCRIGCVCDPCRRDRSDATGNKSLPSGSSLQPCSESGRSGCRDSKGRACPPRLRGGFQSGH